MQKVSKSFNTGDAKTVGTLLANHFRWFTSQCPKTNEKIEDMSNILYTSAVGCLMYAMVCTKPDLAQAVSMVSKFMVNPNRPHWNAVKWIFRYLRGR